jgi:sarcosine oxidase subunit alpha
LVLLLQSARVKCSRTRPVADADRALFVLDGEPFSGRRGEPVAVALFAGGVDVFARSVKYHRPRGPFCLDGGCEGCLARVDGRPNIPTCQTRVTEGLVIERQNAFPTAQVDFLQAIDWFFPAGMQHHEMFAWLPGPLHRAMQRVARRVGGLGTVPEAAPTDVPPVRRAQVDVLVVGGGPAGLAAAAEAARRGRRVLLVEEDEEPGGALRWDPGDVGAGGAWRTALVDDAVAAGVTIRTETLAAAVYDLDTIVLASAGGVEVTSAQDLVLCNGTHAQPALHEGNDLPGHLSARAVLRALLVHGLRTAERAVVAGPDALGAVAAEALAAAGAEVARLGAGERLVRARGDSRVSSVEIADASGKMRRVPCDLVVVAESPAPAFELAQQAGAVVDFRAEAAGFVPRTDDAGRIRTPRVRVAGHAAGARSLDSAIETGRRAGALPREETP